MTNGRDTSKARWKKDIANNRYILKQPLYLGGAILATIRKEYGIWAPYHWEAAGMEGETPFYHIAQLAARKALRDEARNDS